MQMNGLTLIHRALLAQYVLSPAARSSQKRHLQTMEMPFELKRLVRHPSHHLKAPLVVRRLVAAESAVNSLPSATRITPLTQEVAP